MIEETATAYGAFLATKQVADLPTGFDIALSDLPASLFDFQQAIVQWACRRGRAAIFADTGLGKSRMQISWADQVYRHTGQNVLIFAPLAVAKQTQQEGSSVDINITICRTQDDVKPGINISNYEMLSHFDASAFGGIVIDESSILKGFDGSTRQALTDFASTMPYRLACTATPAPNDLLELANHAEFLGVMKGKEIIALFFTQDGNTTHTFRLKGHAKKSFYRWLASWAVALRNPADLGFDGSRYDLPPLNIIPHIIDSAANVGRLFAVESLTLSEQLKARRETVEDRVAIVSEAVNASGESVIVWCNLNSESTALAKAIPDAVEVTGSDSAEKKAKGMLDFSDGDVRGLISKSSICGFGMNWQHCHEVWFVGYTHSFEEYYQAIRRCWRFGQTEQVNVHIVATAQDGAVAANLQRKEREYNELMDNLVQEIKATGLSLGSSSRDTMEYREEVATGKDYTLYLGDCVHQLRHVANNTIGLTVTSVPFPSMYTYTNSPHDMGNTKGQDEMLAQFGYLIPELLRVTMPGRQCCIHMTQTPVFKGVDGYVGLKDFRGKTIAMMEAGGWIYYGEACIDKDPQVKAVRTKERSLLFSTLGTDASLMRMAMADYLLCFMKPGQNPIPIRAGVSKKYNPGGGWITPEEWIEWAHPVWRGIRETNVLNVAVAREGEDERHLCPLQLDVIERAVKLWSAPGDTVLDPFNGIASTGYMALKLNRKYVGIELKESYYRTALNNLERANRERNQGSLWADLDEEAIAE